MPVIRITCFPSSRVCLLQEIIPVMRGLVSSIKELGVAPMDVMVSFKNNLPCGEVTIDSKKEISAEVRNKIEEIARKILISEDRSEIQFE